MTHLDDQFLTIYNCFKVMLYDKSLRNNDGEDPNALTLQEVICMEIIIALDQPTVSEFSSFAKLSGSNSAYRIRKLIEKGYAVKIQNPEDKREFYLKATDKYAANYGLGQDYVVDLCKRVNQNMSEEEMKAFAKGLECVCAEILKDTPSTLK